MQADRRTGMSLAAFCLSSALTFSAATALATEPAAEHDHNHAAASSASHGDQSQRAAMHEMQAMHAKLMAAKTPAERQELMAAHMKAMQDGMKAMQRMGGKDSSGYMSMRMDMMTMMMQMMMDRQQMMGGMGGGMGVGMRGGAAAPTTPSTPTEPPKSPQQQ